MITLFGPRHTEQCFSSSFFLFHKNRTSKVLKCTITNNAIKSEADFTVRKIYFSNIWKGTAFLLQGTYEIPWRRKTAPFEILE